MISDFKPMATGVEPAQIGQPRQQPIAGLVEHLRTVHFSLLAVSFALIAVCATTTEGELKTAYHQLQQIIESARSWDPEFLDQQVRRILTQKNPNLLEDAESFEWPSEAINRIRVLKPAVNWTVTDSRGFPHLTSPSEEPYVGRFILRGPSHGFEPPENIADFSAYWNWLRTTNLHVPTDLDDEVFEEQNDGAYKSVPLVFGSGWFGPDEPAELVAVDPKLRARMPRAKVWSSSGAYGYLISSGLRLIPVRTEAMSLDGQGALIDRYRDWRRGEFSYSFRQLDKVSEAYKTASLDMAERILRAEVERSGSPFEAFGTKIPAELVTLWGPVIVLAVQVYFCLHLSQLRRQGFAMQEVDSIAWIALYTSPWARRTTYLSAALLPSGAIITAIYRAHNERALDWQEWTLRVSVLLLSVWCSGFTARIIYQLSGSGGRQNENSDQAKEADGRGAKGRQVQSDSTSPPQSEI